VKTCQAISNDGHALPWILFGDINHTASNFDAKSVEASPTSSGVSRGNSAQIGSFSAGTPGGPGYSLDVGQLLSLSGDESSTFDLMIQFGETSIYSHMFRKFQKTRGHFINNDNINRSNGIGEHGLWGSSASPRGGYYAAFCAVNGKCARGGHDFWTFSTNGRYPVKAVNVICGFSLSSSWKECSSGDNAKRMRYYIRFNPVVDTKLFPMVGSGSCLDALSRKFTTLSRGGCETLQQCQEACNFFPESECRGFNFRDEDPCGICELNMDASFQGSLSGWSLDIPDDAGSGPVDSSRPSTDATGSSVCHRRLPRIHNLTNFSANLGERQV